jgi:hypothetical protein
MGLGENAPRLTMRFIRLRPGKLSVKVVLQTASFRFRLPQLNTKSKIENIRAFLLLQCLKSVEPFARRGA